VRGILHEIAVHYGLQDSVPDPSKQSMHLMMHHYDACKHDLTKFRTVFTIQRNPWARAYSSWRWLAKEEYAKWCLICRSNGHTVNRATSFSDFVVSDLPELMYKIIVFLPQHHFWLRTKGQPKVQRLVHENLEAEVNALFQKEGWFKAGDSVSLSPGQEKKNDPGQNWCRHYTRQAADMISRLYAKDLEILGYKFDCPEHSLLNSTGA